MIAELRLDFNYDSCTMEPLLLECGLPIRSFYLSPKARIHHNSCEDMEKLRFLQLLPTSSPRKSAIPSTMAFLN